MNRTIKNILLLVSACFLMQNAIGQDDRDFRIGFKIIPGLNWTKSKTSNIQKQGSGIGFSFGLMADIKIADNYFFTPEINVTSMNNSYKLKDTATGSVNIAGVAKTYNKISYKYNFKYIEIPLIFKFRTNEIAGMRYWGQIGVAPGFIIGNQVTTTATPVDLSAPYPISEKYIPNSGDNDKYDFKEHEDNINVLRASMILGAGIEYRLGGNTSFYGGLRFNNGFTDISNDKKSKVINNVFGLELGVFF